MDSSSEQNIAYDLALKILIIGDSGVGKTSLVLSFTSKYTEYSAPTIGTNCDRFLNSVLYVAAGQERFRTLISSYYRSAQGILLVYDVTRRETFTNLSDVWTKEVDLYSTNKNCIKMLVGNKVDKESERVVSREEGIELAKQLGCLFYECSAKTKKNVDQCFQELALKTYSFYIANVTMYIMKGPGLEKEESPGVKLDGSGGGGGGGGSEGGSSGGGSGSGGGGGGSSSSGGGGGGCCS
ncbi:unnamed protein product [Camellia sinensis]